MKTEHDMKDLKKTSVKPTCLEPELQTLSSRYEAILSVVPDIIMEVDENKTYTWANQAGLDFFGEDVIGKEASFYFEGEQETYDRVKPIFEDDENVIYVESWQRRKDGEKRLLAWWCRVLKASDGKVTGAISMARDITEQKQTEQELRFQNQLFQNTLASLSHPFYVIDASNYKIMMANAAASIFGSISNDTTCYSLTHNRKQPCRGKSHICPLKEVKRTKKPVTVEHIHYDKDGEPRYFEIHRFPIFDEAGNVVQMIEYSLDITDRKRVEEALLESEAKWRSLTEYSPDYIMLLNRHAKILFINHTVAGLSREEVIGTSFYDYALPEHREVTEECFKRVFKTASPDKFYSTYRDADGILHFFESYVRPVMKSGKIIGLTVSSRDITERKQAEQLLEESGQRFRSITQTASDAIITIDSHGKVIFWNRAAEQIFGYSVDDMYEKPIMLIMPERYHSAHEKGMKRVASTGKSNLFGKTIEMTGLRKDGSEFPVELSISSWNTKDEMFFTGILRDISERKQMQEALKKSHDELESRVAERTSELERANESLRAKMIAHKKAEKARKIAERKLAEQRVLSMRSDRLRSLGQMAAGIAHELNQPLVGVRGLAEHLLIGLTRGWEFTEEKLREKLSLIIEQADRMSHIIEHVRLFAREAGKQEMLRVHINEVVRSAMELLSEQFRSRGLVLESELCQDECTVFVNPFSVEEVILNLLINARDAVEEKLSIRSDSTAGRILLRTAIEQTESKKLVRIEVIDSGIGIKGNLLAKLFDPFFTTKAPDKGTGLGLSISKSIIEQFDGTIDIRSVHKEGTTVTITLPVTGE